MNMNMNMNMKTRTELLVVTEDHGGYLGGYCALCGDCGWINDIKHKSGCLLKDPGVTHVRMTACRARVVLSGADGKYWWRGPSGARYEIERRGRYWVMHECSSSGKAICDNARLTDIRQYIVDNQGRL